MHPLTTENETTKQQFLYKAEELQTNGLTAGSLYGLQFDFTEVSDSVEFF